MALLLPAWALFAFLLWLLVAGRIPAFVLWIYMAASGTAILLYAADKSAATSRRWRIPESTLHIVALLGGWPGALIAQHVFRHKSAKNSFLVVFWVTAIVNFACLVYLV